jgi:hypothetical protein
MSNFKTGKDLLTCLDILPFELFDHVINGLQPFDKLGRPIPPPDITDKLKSLNGSKNELDSLLCSWPQLTNEELHKRLKSNPREAVWYCEQRQRYHPRMEKLSRDIEDLKNELLQIKDKYSWANYELPEDDKSAEWVINSLLNALFKEDDFIGILEKGSSAENRDKTKDLKQCRETAKEYVAYCNAEGKNPFIAEAIRNIRSLDCGMIYSEKQIRTWITRGPSIFPKDSSKKGRRKNS